VVLLSPLASLEDLLAAATVAKEALGVAEVFVGGRRDGWQDDFLKRADENPNRKGLELVAQALGLAVRPFGDLAGAVAAGKVRAVWAVGTEVPDAAAAAALEGAEVLVAQAYGDGPVARQATVLLPASPPRATGRS
jgi:NADH-quinone oxidoreductase subunit G